MLVSQLYSLFDNNVPKKEIIIRTGCPKGDGIWDVLGSYDYKSYLIKICEPEIKEYSRELEKKLKHDSTYTRLVLTELVRLHEHVHSLLHTGNFYLKRRYKMGYKNFPPTINEPLTEFIAWSTVQNLGIKIFEDVFNLVDKDSPTYY